MTREALPAATVILLRDGVHGLETLLLRRHRNIAFGGGAWVFPGGRVDDADLVDDDEEASARRAAVRECIEEAGLTVSTDDLVPYSHWTPPEEAPKRFATWFFAVAAPTTGPAVTVDGGEIVEHDWVRPDEALARAAAGEVELMPPTWVTLHELSGVPDVASALRSAASRDVPRYQTQFVPVEGGLVSLWHGDAGYGSGDLEAEGGRHRLWMTGTDWRFERSHT